MIALSQREAVTMVSRALMRKHRIMLVQLTPEAYAQVLANIAVLGVIPDDV